MFSKTRRRLTIYFSILMILFLLAFNGIGYLLLSAYVYSSQEKQIQEIADNYLRQEHEMLERLLEGDEKERDHNTKKYHERGERGGWSAGTLRIFYLVVDAQNQVVSGNIPLLEHPDELIGQLTSWQPKQGENRYFTVGYQEDEKIELVVAGRQIMDDGKNIGTLYAGADVSAQKAVLRQLMFVLIGLSAFFVLISALLGYVMSGRAMKPIADSFERQKRFVSDASHELRTPLSIIHASLEVLEAEEGDKLGAFSRQVLGDLKDETRRMSSLVTHLLSLAQGDSSELSLNMEDFMLRDEIMKVIRQVKPLAQEKELFLEADIPSELPVYADKERLRQLLLILLDNALRYTPKGGGGITVTAKPDGRDIALAVTDTGIGIPQEKHEEIFERFFRADPSRDRGTGQAGLGLSIAKWIAEAHGGRITVQSSPGQGSIFTVRLPIFRSTKEK
jgi:signal transduction histidine kinase